MAEYIERKVLLEKLVERDLCLCVSESDINAIPSADVAPVRHGRWIEGVENFTFGNHNAECSVCGANISWSGCDEDFNYCPNCGAKLDLPPT